MLGLEGAFLSDTQIFSLLGGKFGELHAKLLQMQTRHFLVQMLGEDLDSAGSILTVLGIPKGDLGQHLVARWR